jgi:hypothetical protein
VFASCGQNKTTKEQTSSETVRETAKIVIASYKILSEKDHVDPNFGFNKCNILVELKSQVSKEELTAIANEIRKTRKTYDKLWIGYSTAKIVRGTLFFELFVFCQAYPSHCAESAP